MSPFDPHFVHFLDQQERLHRRRTLRAVESAAAFPGAPGQAPRLDFRSNDYLGLASHPALIARACDYVRRYGAGATASRLVCGTRAACLEIEAKLANAKGTEAALLFSSGWQANATVLAALLQGFGRDTQIYVDRLAHASLHQGCRAAGIREIRFRHNDLDHLAALLQGRAHQPGRRIIVTESVFSMDGDRSDILGLTALAERYGAFLYLDEAHATGVLGPGGMGLAGLAPGRVDLSMGTFSKALGGFGAYVAGSRALCDYLINTCSGFIFTTALPPAVLGAIDAALDLVPGLEATRATLARRAAQLRDTLSQLGLDTGPSTTQIIPVLIGDENDTLRASHQLEQSGVLVAAIRPPTVPTGTSRLRIALSAAHTQADLDTLTTTLAATMRLTA